MRLVSWINLTDGRGHPPPDLDRPPCVPAGHMGSTQLSPQDTGSTQRSPQDRSKVKNNGFIGVGDVSTNLEKHENQGFSDSNQATF